MHEFLLGLLTDLERHCALLLDRIKAVQYTTDLADAAVSAYFQVETIRRACVNLQSSPSLGVASLLPNHFRSFNLWSQEVTLIEYFLLPCLERFAVSDQRLTLLCRTLAKEVSWPLDPPLVAAFSNDYYWTLPIFNTVWVPATEDMRLLALPDLVHELAHPLYSQDPAALVGNFVDLLTNFVHTEQQRASANQSPTGQRYFQLLLRQWRESWLEEFVCDMVATYVLGAPYGYQHVRLASTTNSDIYHPSLGEQAIHPADDARLHAISALLRHAPGVDNVDRLEAHWNQYVAMRGVARPGDYSLCYPQFLLTALAERVVAGCQALGMRRYDDTIEGKSVGVCTLVRTAWEQFLTDPSQYGDWEASHVDELWRQLGVGQ